MSSYRSLYIRELMHCYASNTDGHSSRQFRTGDGWKGRPYGGQHLSEAHFPVLVHGDQIKHRSDDKKESGAIKEGSIQQRWIVTTKIPSKPPGTLPNRSRKYLTTGINESWVLTGVGCDTSMHKNSRGQKSAQTTLLCLRESVTEA